MAQYGNATTEADREERLYNKQMASDSDYRTAVATAMALQATTQADEAAIRTAALQLERCQVNAPITGAVGRFWSCRATWSSPTAPC